jgi:hypothetical protein
MVSKDRVEEAARAYLDALISTSLPSTVVRAILLGDSGGFTREELNEIATGGSRERRSPHHFSKGKIRRISTEQIAAVAPKKKRKVSKYQREFGRQMKILKKKHPRTPVTKLMKRAHSATKREMKK